MFPCWSLSRMPTSTPATLMGDDSSVAWPLMKSGPPDRLNLMLVGSLCATGHGGVWSQSGSTQSVFPSQSLSIMSLHISGDGMHGCVVLVVVVVLTVVVVTQTMCIWSHMPAPSQPAVVHWFWSVSGHGVLSGVGGYTHPPVCGLQNWGSVQGLLSGGQTVVMWFWSQPSRIAPAGEELSVPLQPANVQRLPSVSPHGVLSGSGSWMHSPVS